MNKRIKRAVIAVLSCCAALLLGAGPAPAQGLLDANCPGPSDDTDTYSDGVNPERVGQTFTAVNTGGLVRAEIEVSKAAVTAADWIVQIVPTDGAGVPTNNVLASASIPDSSVPGGISRLVAPFSPGANVEAGKQYAFVMARPGAASFGVRERTGNPCPAQEFESPSETGGWTPASDVGEDIVFATYVKPPNAFTLGKIRRNLKKGTATIAVNLPGPGELTGSGKGIKVAGAAVISKTVTAPGTVRLTIKAKGKKKKRKLKRNGKVGVKPKITYTPTGGDPNTQSVKLKLKKKPRNR